MPKSDIAIVTVIREEYAAIIQRLKEEGCVLESRPGSSKAPNQYGWLTGKLTDSCNRVYELVIAGVMMPGPAQMASAIHATIQRFKPRYVLLVGIAGGFTLDGLLCGDIAISSVIYNYEYGKLAAEFEPRHDFVYQVDSALLRSAIAVNEQHPSWARSCTATRPAQLDETPKLIPGAIASGNKIVDDADNDFFAAVLGTWPKLLAIEMEGAGAAAAIGEVQSSGRTVGFLMVRGISDLPVVRAGKHIADPQQNKHVRDGWKKYAAAVAAHFTVHWIKNGWPILPTRQPRSSKNVQPSQATSGHSAEIAETFKESMPQETSDPFLTSGQRSVQTVGIINSLADMSVALKELGRSNFSQLKSLLAEITESISLNDAPDKSAVESELEIIKVNIDQHKNELAESQLDALESRAVGTLEPHQWYQLKALRSRLYSARWQWEKAGRLLIDAKRHLPTSDRGRINEALGFELVGEREKAHALSSSLRTEITQSVKLHTIWVRTAPDSEGLDSLIAQVATFTHDDEELNLALANRALIQSRFDKALEFATRATEIDPKSPHAWFVLGQSKHMHGAKLNSGSPILLLRDAAAHYDLAVELAQIDKFPGLEAAIRLNRGRVRYLLNDARAESDFQRAIELASPEQRMRTEYAGFLLQLGRYSDALRELDAEPGPPTSDNRFLEAVVKYERNLGDDRAQATECLKTFAGSRDSNHWEEAQIILVQASVNLRSLPETTDVSVDERMRETNPLLFHTLHAWISLSNDDHRSANTSLRQAMEQLSPTSQRDHIFLLAQALLVNDEDALALPLLERCYHPGLLDETCKKLLDTARRLERHDVLGRVCCELREAGSQDTRVVETEISTLQLYDPEQALNLAREYLEQHPTNRHVAVWQAILALRLDRRDLLITDVSRFPPVSEITPEASSVIVRILNQDGRTEEALRYAYESVRAHFDAEFAHGMYVAWFLELSESIQTLRLVDTVTVGTAVCYEEADADSQRWIIIEDGLQPELARNEFLPTHPFSHALIGHHVGEVVALSEPEQARTVTIIALVSKFVYRFRDCLDSYQMRFPGGGAIQMMRVGTGDKFDPSAIAHSLKRRKESIEKLNDLYRTKPMPFELYVELVGRNSIDVWSYLASNEKLGIRCARGDEEGLRVAVDTVRNCRAVVLDLTAIITLAHLGLLDNLGRSRREFIVAQSLFDQVQELVENARDSESGAGSIVLTEGGELARIESTPENLERYFEFVTKLRDRIRSHCKIRPCRDAAALPPLKRHKLTEVFGRHGLDTILLSQTPDIALWTDDYPVEIIAQSEFHIRRVWTQPVLYVLCEDGVVSEVELNRAVAKLVGWYYQGTQLNHATLIAAAELAGWDGSQWPMKQTMQSLGNSDSDHRKRLAIAARAIRDVWRRTSSNQENERFLFAVLSGLNSDYLVRELHQLIPVAFSVDVVASDEVQQIIAGWMRRPPGPILF